MKFATKNENNLYEPEKQSFAKLSEAEPEKGGAYKKNKKENC